MVRVAPRRDALDYPASKTSMLDPKRCATSKRAGLCAAPRAKVSVPLHRLNDVAAASFRSPFPFCIACSSAAR